MAAQSLVLCRDPDVLRTLCPLLFDLDMGVEICLGLNGATRMLRKRKFDAVIIECESDGTGLNVLQELRSDNAHRNTIAVGVVDDHNAMQAALDTGANFVLAKPISVEDAGRILRSARGMVGRMVRRFLRVVVNSLSHVDIVGMEDPAFILDLSEGGIALQSLAPMCIGQSVNLTFLLPGTETRIHSHATVVWVDPTGRIGLEFKDLSDHHRYALKFWVTEHMGNISDRDHQGTLPDWTSVRVLSRWMRPLARLIDATFILIAAAIFCLVAFFMLRLNPPVHFPVGFAFALAVFIGGLLYSSLFSLLNVRFPGTRAMQSLLAMASTRITG
jgi:CheY-like chemotaxis protein